ncbi:MAG TPA: LemA family protein [Gemmatimonadaceae bacterium]|nr:LemA family protein [Gemmatimonadaceae bacterium]
MFRRWLVVALTALTAGCGYNRIQSLDERAQAYQGQIEVQLQRRADLIPNLVQTVKGYAQHEEQVLTNVTNARSGLLNAVKSGDPEAMATANAQMTGALGRLLAVVENYPNLKADQSFLRLQDELAGTENRVAVARNDYNGAVNEYNAYIRQFPAVLTAKVTGAKPRKYFNAAPGATEAPKVDFSAPPPTAPPSKAPSKTP